MSVDRVNHGAEQRNVNRRTTEEYRNREKELKKQHAQQVQKLREEHENSLKKVKKENEENLSAFKSQAKDRFTKQDLVNQEKINEMNRVHKSQLKKTADDYERRLTFEKNQGQSTLEHVASSKDEQLRSVRENYDEYLKKKTDEFNDQIVETRDKTQAGLRRERTQLQDHFEREKNRIEKSRREDVTELQRAKDLERRQKDAQIQSLKEQHRLSHGNIKDKYDLTLSHLNETHQSRSEAQREAFNEGLQEIRNDSYETRLKQQEEYDTSLQRLREQTNERTLNQVGRLEREIAVLKHGRIEDNVKTKSEAKKERESLLDQIRHRQEVMERERQAAITDSNQKNQVVIEKINKQSHEHMSNQAKFFKEKISNLEFLKDEQAREKINALEDQLRRKEVEHKVQFGRERARSEVEKRDLEERYKTMLGQMRKAHSETILDQKTRAMRERSEAINNMERILKSHEIKNEEKIQMQAQKYEEKIQTLTANARNEVAKERELGVERLKNQERHHIMQMKTQELQAKNTLEQVKEKYEAEVDQLRNRIEKMHQEMNRPKNNA